MLLCFLPQNKHVCYRYHKMFDVPSNIVSIFDQVKYNILPEHAYFLLKQWHLNLGYDMMNCIYMTHFKKIIGNIIEHFSSRLDWRITG